MSNSFNITRGPSGELAISTPVGSGEISVKIPADELMRFVVDVLQHASADALRARVAQANTDPVVIARQNPFGTLYVERADLQLPENGEQRGDLADSARRELQKLAESAEAYSDSAQHDATDDGPYDIGYGYGVRDTLRWLAGTPQTDKLSDAVTFAG